MLSVHGPHKYKSFGLGGALYTDVTGPTSKTGMYLSYAYNFKATDYTKISFGLSGGMMQYRVDGTKITLAEPGDITLANTLMNKIIPDFKRITGDAQITINLKDFPVDTAASSPLGPFTISSSTQKVDTRARGRAASLKIENTGSGQSWRYGTFRADVQPDGRR